MVEELGAGIGIDCPLAGGEFLIPRWRLDSSVATVTIIKAVINDESGGVEGCSSEDPYWLFVTSTLLFAGGSLPRGSVQCVILTIQCLGLRMSGSEPYIWRSQGQLFCTFWCCWGLQKIFGSNLVVVRRRLM
jgi:hypothetical protein